MGHFGRLSGHDHKGAVDLVTVADREAEALVKDGLLGAFPADAFLGEEGGTSGVMDAPWCWVVDPLDGTTNYVHGLPHFAVSIGLLHHGQPVVGVLLHPPRRQLFHAVVGHGAWLGQQRLLVSTESDLGASLIATGFPYDRRDTADRLTEVLAGVLRTARGVRRQGAAACDLIEVAQGVFEGFWERALNPWDVAAGVVLVTEAGGRVSGFGGRPLTLDGGEIIASNGLVHDALAAVVGDG